jgi:hypothetical protein
MLPGGATPGNAPITSDMRQQRDEIGRGSQAEVRPNRKPVSDFLIEVGRPSLDWRVML